MEEQIKSKERVAEHGEVFTNTREVNAMLDMVQSESERIDSRFLEPACGTGNFLAEVLRRKLVTVTTSPAISPANQIIVESLLHQFCPKARIESSALVGQVR